MLVGEYDNNNYNYNLQYLYEVRLNENSGIDRTLVRIKI